METEMTQEKFHHRRAVFVFACGLVGVVFMPGSRISAQEFQSKLTWVFDGGSIIYSYKSPSEDSVFHARLVHPFAKKQIIAQAIERKLPGDLVLQVGTDLQFRTTENFGREETRSWALRRLAELKSCCSTVGEQSFLAAVLYVSSSEEKVLRWGAGAIRSLEVGRWIELFRNAPKNHLEPRGHATENAEVPFTEDPF